MKRSPDNFRDFSPLQIAAAEWLMLRDSGFTREQQESFQSWLAADSEHAKIFQALDETWDALDRLNDSPLAKTTPDPDSLAPHRVIRMRNINVRRGSWAAMALAAAAALAISFVGWRQISSGRNFTEIAMTELGELQKMQLPDGSVVHLNTDSALEIQYVDTARRVNLMRGEAHFTIAKNAARPFFVTAGGVDVRAIGTSFNVRLRNDAVEILVTEGTVRVADAIKGESLLALPRTPAAIEDPQQPNSQMERMLFAGERAKVMIGREIAPAVVPVTVPSAEVERALAWHERKLAFDAVPLADMVAEFNRYNRHKLVLADERLASQPFGGVFRADGYETLVHLLELNHRVVVERREGETLLKLAP